MCMKSLLEAWVSISYLSVGVLVWNGCECADVNRTETYTYFALVRTLCDPNLVSSALLLICSAWFTFGGWRLSGRPSGRSGLWSSGGSRVFSGSARRSRFRTVVSSSVSCCFALAIRLVGGREGPALSASSPAPSSVTTSEGGFLAVAGPLRFRDGASGASSSDSCVVGAAFGAGFFFFLDGPDSESGWVRVRETLCSQWSPGTSLTAALRLPLVERLSPDVVASSPVLTAGSVWGEECNRDVKRRTGGT